MREFKETAAPKESHETDAPVMREGWMPIWQTSEKLPQHPYESELERRMGSYAASGIEKSSDAKESNEDKDHSKYLEKGDDGKYYDKETGRAYDSIETWEKAMETAAKRYDGTAEYYTDKAKKEWARFKNAEANGESNAEKWEHYKHSKEYFERAKECKEKAGHIWEKLGNELIKNELIKNKDDGLAREKEVAGELEKKYPPEKGNQIVPEAYLRDKDGNIVKDPVTGEARRIDFVVVKDGKVVDSVEVTSKTADKTEQSAKEERIRGAGGNYIRDKDGNLVQIPSTVHTRIERRN